MMNSNALTVPLALLIGWTLSPPAAIFNNLTPTFNYYIESPYQTTSINPIANDYSIINPKADALDLFGIQSNFSLDEQETYVRMLEQNSKNTGINISNLF